MQNTEFNDILLLLASKKTFNQGLELAQNFLQEFENRFHCTIDEYKELVYFLVENEVWDFEMPLGKLEELDLSRKKIIKLPENLALLNNLKILFLNNNQLITLPESITKLKNLECLYLENNQLKSLPKNIGDLESLQELDLANNQLNTLPKSIEKLSLERMMISDNPITSFPKKTSGGEIYLGKKPTFDITEYLDDWSDVIFDKHWY